MKRLAALLMLIGCTPEPVPVTVLVAVTAPPSMLMAPCPPRPAVSATVVGGIVTVERLREDYATAQSDRDREKTAAEQCAALLNRLQVWVHANPVLRTQESRRE